MPRFAIGVTLTAQERAAMNLAPAGSRTGQEHYLLSHTLTAALTDGTSCLMRYRRYGARCHSFVFEEPLGETVWLYDRIGIGTLAIEEKAQEFAAQAFKQEMANEQKLMRRKTVPKGARVPMGEPHLQVKTANLLAGQYAVCMRFGSGLLSAIGTPRSDCEFIVAAWQDGTFEHVQLFGQQRLVIGICCRYLRRWVEPQFLPFPRGGTSPAAPDPS